MKLSLSTTNMNKLLSFSQRKLNKGEIFLLAKCLSDIVPIACSTEENIRTHVLNHRSKIDNILYGLDNYIYIPTEDKEVIYKIIDGLVMWRTSLAYNPAQMVFSSDPNTVIDDVTGILRYVDASDICGLSDIADSANVITSMFREVISSLTV